jgi:uncharacterized protein
VRKTIVVLCVALLLAGCANMKTSKAQYVGVDQKLQNHDYAGALAQIETAKTVGYKEKEKVLYYLDAGMLQHYDKKYPESNDNLTLAEEGITENYTKSVSRAAVSLLLNDNTLDYWGEDYEDLYLNVFKAMNYLELKQTDEAFVEVRRVNEKLNLLEDKYSKLAQGYNSSDSSKATIKPGASRFHNSALARYMSMLMYRSENDLDNARIDHDKIIDAWTSQPTIYNYAMPNIDQAVTPTSEARVNVMGLIGRSPDKSANTFYVHTEDDLIVFGFTEENEKYRQQLTDLDFIAWPGVKKGYHFKLQVPFMVSRGTEIGRVRMLVDDQTQDLQLLEDIDKVAQETYNIKLPIIYLKTVVRSVVKGLVAEKQKENLDAQAGGGLGGFLARAAVDAAVDATENADLRISQFFPAQILVGELQVPAGQHAVKIEYYAKNGALLWTDDRGVCNIPASGLNLYESYYLR